MSARACILAFAVALVLPGVAAIEPAAAGPTPCLAAPPRTASGYQAIADSRGSDFGVGDLMSMVPLPDGRNLFVFGDTAYAPVNGDGSRGALTGFGNNSMWVQNGACFTLLDSPAGNRSVVVPAADDGTVYWPGSAVVAGNRLHVFLTRTRLDNLFGTPLGSAVATFELPSLELARVASTPFSTDRVFGGGAVYDGGYLYTYASKRDNCQFCFAGDMFVARVREDLVAMPSAWQYYSAGSWASDPLASTPVINDGMGNASVIAWRNGFLLVTKTFGIVAPDVDAWWAPNPEGPWQKLGKVMDLPQPPPARIAGYTYHDAFTYQPTVLPNAAVEGGGALLGYNVLSFDESEALLDARGMGPRFASAQLPEPPPAPPRAASVPAPSPWDPVIATNLVGQVRVAGGSVPYTLSHTQSAVGVARTVTGLGSWVVARDGGVFSVGDAQFYGSTGGMRLNQPVVGIASTPTGRGYWLVASDGGVFSFGDAQFFGSTGSMRLNRPILGMASTPTGRGYWLVASDGGVFSFGDAVFFGSTGGIRLNWPVTDIASTPSGRGYYLVSLEGSVFAFGDARYGGNAPYPPAHAVVGVSVVPGGYRLIDASGRVFNRGAARGPDDVGPASWIPIVGIA